MCYKVDCKQCGKTTWGGCGKHLKTLYPTIAQGKHCTCRSWPGVDTASSAASSTTTTTTTTGMFPERSGEDPWRTLKFLLISIMFISFIKFYI
ncbi:hypothetical protein DCAR_0729496 [Daucus carota subsp. sativus]|uniref:Uncharacterized protein n=1 Tax=Daucus carota subsp. sativus TaxID=79200 RepID=A0AAF0XKX8_DAUCS|nr:hypothetical protein DCAR_0729496 [Daucus carota subsp. sativus]